MSVFDTLVTDRTEADVAFLKALIKKGLAGMSEEELDYFLGRNTSDPLYASDGRLSAQDGDLYAMGSGGQTVIKGAYNYTDLNRVSSAVYALDEMLMGFGYKTGVKKVLVPHEQYDGYDAYTWYETDVPNSETMGKYLENLSKLRSVIIAPASTPPVPSDMDGLTVTEANNIEKIIAELNQLIINMSLAWFYSGELYAGEV